VNGIQRARPGATVQPQRATPPLAGGAAQTKAAPAPTRVPAWCGTVPAGAPWPRASRSATARS
jgi:hypothetical protein